MSSGAGTELPIPNVRSSVANGGKADKICSMRVLRILTQSGHRPAAGFAAHRASSCGEPKMAALFEHLVSTYEERWGDDNPERTCGFPVYVKLENGGFFDWEVSGPDTF